MSGKGLLPCCVYLAGLHTAWHHTAQPANIAAGLRPCRVRKTDQHTAWTLSTALHSTHTASEGQLLPCCPAMHVELTYLHTK
jgi:hypothetical protein